MALINENFLKLKAGYLFPEIGRRMNSFVSDNPTAEVIRLGIGDVVKGIPRVIIDALKEATEELAHDETFQGYPPDQGGLFLREAIAEHDFASRGVEIDVDEIFISDGSKCDSANIQEIFGIDNTVALTDPVYPVYCDTNVMAGRTGDGDESGGYEGLVYLPCTLENGFNPPLPNGHVDLIYLCAPNKLFEYCMASVPVIGCDFPEVSRVLQESPIGELFDVDSPDSIAAAIDRLLGDPDRLRQAREATADIRERHHWGVARRELERLYDGLFK